MEAKLTCPVWSHPQTTSIESPGVQHQLAEAERKLEEMRTALLEVMKERWDYNKTECVYITE